MGGPKMRFFSLMCLCAVAIPLGGCFNNYNLSVPEKGKEALDCPPPASSDAGQQTIINLNNGMPATQATGYAPAGYQEVFTTEYTPCGPVVRKAIVPVYGGGAVNCGNILPQQAPVQQGIVNYGNPFIVR